MSEGRGEMTEQAAVESFFDVMTHHKRLRITKIPKARVVTESQAAFQVPDPEPASVLIDIDDDLLYSERAVTNLQAKVNAVAAQWGIDKTRLTRQVGCGVAAAFHRPRATAVPNLPSDEDRARAEQEFASWGIEI